MEKKNIKERILEKIESIREYLDFLASETPASIEEIYSFLKIPKIFKLKKADVIKQAQGMKMYIMRLK